LAFQRCELVPIQLVQQDIFGRGQQPNPGTLQRVREGFCRGPKGTALLTPRDRLIRESESFGANFLGPKDTLTDFRPELDRNFRLSLRLASYRI
jgi:hypothetical protein